MKFSESFEFYLAEDIYYALTKRLQHSSIVEAGLNDISVCTECRTEVWIDRDVQFYDCYCGRRQCRNCPRIYDKDHEGVSCAELDRQQSPTIEAKLSEIAIRICSNCKLRFIQHDGCNKMQCQCGTKQCYVCKETIEDYSHFCRCGWKGTSGQCPKCKRSCPLYGAAQHKDNIMMEEVKSKFNSEMEKNRGLLKKLRSVLRNLPPFSIVSCGKRS